jgi:hypothetical protein
LSLSRRDRSCNCERCESDQGRKSAEIAIGHERAPVDGARISILSDSEHELETNGDLLVPPGCCGYLKEVEMEVATGKWAVVRS